MNAAMLKKTTVLNSYRRASARSRFWIFWLEKVGSWLANWMGGDKLKLKWGSLVITIVQSLARMVFSLLTGAHFFALLRVFVRVEISW